MGNFVRISSNLYILLSRTLWAGGYKKHYKNLRTLKQPFKSNDVTIRKTEMLTYIDMNKDDDIWYHCSKSNLHKIGYMYALYTLYNHSGI